MPSLWPLFVYTSRITYSGSDGIDVTVKSALPENRCFAPTWEILTPLKAAKAKVDALLRTGNVSSSEYGEAKAAYLVAWEVYEQAYLALMRLSYKANKPRWEAVLGSERAVLLCYCTNIRPFMPYARCHRIVLARIFEKLGAIYGGEVR